MSLAVYRKKRDFKATSEPRGKRPQAKGNSFVIQKHAARRLHYDLRLEMNGVLKSWAVTRGPSLIPGEKRLAVHVEDHPLEYGSFEGTIPKGEYGGGTVLVWDRGAWWPVGDADKGFAKGHLVFELQGEKLHGRWHLVRIEGKPREKKENWLLIKDKDGAARRKGEPEILDERPQSVTTGRAIEDIAGEAPGWPSKTGRIELGAEPARPVRKADPSKVKGAKKAKLPDFVEPELATLVKKPPSGGRWIHEIKFDGYRLQARIDAGKVKLLTRTGLDWTAKFGKDILAAFQALPVKTALIDGELVVENAGGVSDFSALQAKLIEGRADGFIFYAFDLLYLDGFDLRAAPLTVRKEALRTLIPADSNVLRYSTHFDQDGGLILLHACRLSLEGVVSKLKEESYYSGRGKGWVKSKCSERQEFVVGGYVPSTTAPKSVGSLVLGHYDGGKLMHAGRAGTGFTAAASKELYRRLEGIASPLSPFAAGLDTGAARKVRYVKPELVAEIAFRGWTADKKLRHASYQGLRDDKAGGEVVRETPAEAAASLSCYSVQLTHPDRLYWPDAGVTKEGLANYYTEVWPRMAPFITARPLALVRCPDGIAAGPCFFQKHAWRGSGGSIRLMRDPKDPKGEPVITIDSLDGLIGLVQAGALEIHPWGSTIEALEQPDILILDLDPGEGVNWQDLIDAALELRERLQKLGLAAFVKTSGGKGLHVVSPLRPKAEWAAVKGFVKKLADSMTEDQPERYVATMTKSKRRGKVLIDYLRNGRGSTAVAPYSTRARNGAPVSMPLSWDELGSGIGPAYFTIANTVPRLASLKPDPWEDFRRAAFPLPSTVSRRRRID